MPPHKPLGLNEACRDHRPGPVEAALASETRQRLTAALDVLADVELQIVTMRFGLAGHRPRSITFIAKILRIKQEDAETTLEAALQRMRNHIDRSPSE
jgi:DNA-directed RNA polymerase sigma subunit (sigma70/sigma32)